MMGDVLLCPRQRTLFAVNPTTGDRCPPGPRLARADGGHVDRGSVGVGERKGTDRWLPRCCGYPWSHSVPHDEGPLEDVDRTDIGP